MVTGKAYDESLRGAEADERSLLFFGAQKPDFKDPLLGFNVAGSRRI